MSRLAPVDWVAIAAYFALVVGCGLWFRRRAQAGLDAYFLGGRRIHWLALSASGAVSNFDITGTMWMVSVLLVVGMQSWWHHWMWGVALPAFALTHMARWVRRSNVMTAAEWMTTRFGQGREGAAARTAYAATAVIYSAAAVGYAFQGIGKFASVYLPLDGIVAMMPLRLPDGTAVWLLANQPAVLAVTILALTTTYVVSGGLYGVVVTDVIQAVVLSLASVLIMGIAYVNLTPELIASHTSEGFFRLAPVWRRADLAGDPSTAAFEMFGLLTIVWVAKGLLMNAGGPAQLYDFQRYLASRDSREATKVAAAWPFFLVLRWGMVMGIALLAATGLVAAGDPELVMPEVLRLYLPPGVRGVVIAGLLAAFMSTFSSTVNAGASFVVRDLWQPLVAPDASEQHLIRISKISTVGVVLVGVAIGFSVDSIAGVWNWMMMALGAGVIIPNVLRWYWWRLNGWGYAWGVAGGIGLSLIGLVSPELPLYVVFPVVCFGSVLGCLVGTFATPPTDSGVLADFYRTVRPFGAWSEVKQAVAAPMTTATNDGGHNTRNVEMADDDRRAGAVALNTLLAIVGITALYLSPMYLVAHRHGTAAFGAAIAIACAGFLYGRLRD